MTGLRLTNTWSSSSSDTPGGPADCANLFPGRGATEHVFQHRLGVGREPFAELLVLADAIRQVRPELDQGEPYDQGDRVTDAE